MTNIALGFTLCYICHLTHLELYIYFLQTGGSALSNTYGTFIQNIASIQESIWPYIARH